MCERTTIIDGRVRLVLRVRDRLAQRVEVVRVVDVLDVPAERLEARARDPRVNEIDVVPSIVMWLSS